ncbi:hypothetical protein ACFO3E_18050 [Sphingobium tyrosinilyticum]|uniref:HEAT repeat domain-containing protein n=2 Tax=Sphingobium tyrosinilyticum TaxID=2715436 RepID=A0ABV9F2B6_9SPHN
MIRTLSLCALGDMALLPASAWLPGGVVGFAFAHLALTLTALAVCLARPPGTATARMLVLPVGAAFGPCGMLSLTLLSPHLWVLRRRRQLTYRPPRTRRYHGARSINPIERLSRILDERIRYPEVDEVGSLAGMLRHGSLQSRYNALETVVTSFEPRLSPLIIIALSDEDQTIRALAAAAAAQISYNLTQQRQELEAKIAPSQNMDDRYALAILLADHGCHNQLLPQAQRMRLCQEAAAQVREIGKMLPEDDVRQRPLRTISSQVALEMIHHKDASPRARAQPLEVAT